MPCTYIPDPAGSGDYRAVGVDGTENIDFNGIISTPLFMHEMFFHELNFTLNSSNLPIFFKA